MTDIVVVMKESFRFAQSAGATTNCSFERLSLRKSSQEMRVLSAQEQHHLITVLTKNMDRYKLGVFVCLFTGIRIGELCALQWKHISFSERTIKIEQTIQRLQCEDLNATCKTHIVITEPKSFCAIRAIPITDFVAEYLKPLTGMPTDYILSGESDTPIEPRTMQNRFKTYLREAQIADANFHALRHTFATRCVEAGFDIKTLSEILGHSSVKITLDRYVHSSMELKRENMGKLKMLR